MPQYGAQGYALKEGRKHAWILAHYYTGDDAREGAARHGARPARPRPLVASRSVVQRAVHGDRRARSHLRVPGGGAARSGRGLRVTVNGQGAQPRRARSRSSRGTRNLRSDGKALPRPARRPLERRQPLGREPRRAREVPLRASSRTRCRRRWHAEALKAQAVAARSYAMVSRKTRRIFDLYPDTREPGLRRRRRRRTRARTPRSTRPRDRSSCTTGRSRGRSSTRPPAGRRRTIRHVWTGGTAYPYLVSVPDPYDTLSPYHHWGPFRYSAAGFKSALGSYAPAGGLLDATRGAERVQPRLVGDPPGKPRDELGLGRRRPVARSGCGRAGSRSPSCGSTGRARRRRGRRSR